MKNLFSGSDVSGLEMLANDAFANDKLENDNDSRLRVKCLTVKTICVGCGKDYTLLTKVDGNVNFNYHIKHLR